MTRSKLPEFLVLASLVLVPAMASADTPSATDDAARASAVHDERRDGTRVAYYAALTTIAERDVKTAEITLDMSREQWEIAVRGQDKDAAEYWAKRHRLAQAEALQARARASRLRVERDSARDDFQDSAAEVRKQDPRG